MTAAIREHDVTVLLGDVREQLATLPDGSVQCVVTSPPYYGLRDYGVDGQIGLEPSPAEYVAEMVAVFREARRALADDGVLWLNLGDSYSSAKSGEQSGGTTTQLNSPVRTIKRDAVFGISPKNLMGIPWRVAFALQDDGWTLRNAIIWHKPNAMPESVTDRLSCRYEHVFLFSKSRRYWFDLDAVREPVVTERLAALNWARDSKEADVPGQSQRQHRRTRGETMTSRHGTQPGNTMQRDPDGGYGVGANVLGKNPGDVWTIPTSPFPGAHFACMPPALAERCILAGCPSDGTVLDPFAGSGTTLKVARSLGRKSIGIELNPDYIDIIRQRIGPEPFDFGEDWPPRKIQPTSPPEPPLTSALIEVAGPIPTLAGCERCGRYPGEACYIPARLCPREAA